MEVSGPSWFQIGGLGAILAPNGESKAKTLKSHWFFNVSGEDRREVPRGGGGNRVLFALPTSRGKLLNNSLLNIGHCRTLEQYMWSSQPGGP